MTMPYSFSDDEATRAKILPAWIWAEGLVPGSAPNALQDELERAVACGEELVPARVRDEVRAMLRHGKYKPSGRGKPASEFLLRAALSGEFPRKNAPVDVNNIVSLVSGLPGSIFDVALSGPRFHLRYGEPGESYVFNPSGQSIDLEDLPVVCRGVGEAWVPCGNPVKDAMETKIRDVTTDVAAILYVPRALGGAAAERWAARYAELLEACCGAMRVGFVLGPSD